MLQQLPGFKCTKCGDCCRGFSEERAVFLFPKDVKRIAAGLAISERSFIESYTFSKLIQTELGKIEVRFLRHVEGSCVFLAKDSTCSIHDFKPEQCQRTPFGFFWDGGRPFECMKDVELPDGWSSESSDEELILTLFEQ